MAMTMTSFLTAVLATSGISEDVATFAKAELAKIDAKNAKRRTTPTAAQVANANMLTDLVGAMGEGEVLTAANAAALLGVSVQKASALLQNGVKSGILTKTEVKVKHARKAVAATFINTTSFAKASKVMDIVPVACLSLVDSGTIEPYTGSDKRYIAKAKLYGQEVFLDKDGNIYKDGVKLRLLFNTVDSERLFKAAWAFNKKLHYECKPLRDDSNSLTELVNDNKTALWMFYWVDPTWCVITAHKELVMRNDTKKWTDDFIVRIARDLVPPSVKDMLTKSFGCAEDAEMSGVKYTNYRMKKSDLEKIINALAAA